MRECSNLAVCSAGMCIFRRDLAFRGKKNQDKKSRLKRFYSFIIVVSYHLNCNKDEKVLSIIYCQKANEKTTSATPATKAKGKEAETAATAILIVVVGFYHCDDCSKRLVPSRDTKRAWRYFTCCSPIILVAALGGFIRGSVLERIFQATGWKLSGQVAHCWSTDYRILHGRRPQNLNNDCVYVYIHAWMHLVVSPS